MTSAPSLREGEGLARYEGQLLIQVVGLRNLAAEKQGSASSRAMDESKLLSGLRQVFALAEGYPELAEPVVPRAGLVG